MVIGTHPVPPATIGALRASVFYRLWRENPRHPLCGWSLTQKLPKRTGKQKISASSLYIYFKINNVTSKTLLKLSNAGILPF
jgi:hypothetical protein